MNNSAALYFLIAGLSVFRFLESWNDKGALSKKSPAAVFLEELLFFAALVVPAVIYFSALKIFPRWADLMFFGIFPAIYFAFRGARFPDSFASGAFAFLSLFVFPFETLSFVVIIQEAALLVCGILFFRFALTGLRFRLLFSNTPRLFKGFGIFLAAAAMISMAFSAVFLRFC